MSDLEKYLKGEPLNEQMAALMENPDQLEPPAVTEVPAPGPIDDDDREHLRRLLVEPGWRVLLKLLDSELDKRKDAAIKHSLGGPLHMDQAELSKMWAQVAYMKSSRDEIVSLAEREVEKLKHATRTQTGRV